MSKLWAGVRWAVPLLLLVLLALALRLLVWRWHEFYPPGGDETEYFNQALTLLREHRYAELQLMRPPGYTAFLAGAIYLFDSLVQRLRLLQAMISALTVLPVYALAAALFANRRVALLAALLAALNYTLAASATELLTETLFVGGLTLVFWLLLRTAGRGALGYAALAGLALGALMLLRSVALPLIPLGALWLLLARRPTTDDGPTINDRRRAWFAQTSFRCAALFVLCSFAVVLPWTARNYRVYGAPILVDTTGAENLWLDNNPSASTANDPLGREAAKQALYALKDDRAARQRLATARGLAEISSHPGWFAAKAWGQAKLFFALQYFDDMRERREIWVPPAEVWLRMLLGDGMWLLLLLAGLAGMCLAPRAPPPQAPVAWRTWLAAGDFRMLALLWLLYVFATGMLFHVELRYRLPVYPVLLVYTAWLLHAGWLALRQAGALRTALAALLVVALGGMTLLHRPYGEEASMLARKHWALWQAERALVANDQPRALAAAQQAQAADPESVLARVAAARADLITFDDQAALAALDQAVKLLPNHPEARLLRGAVLRAQNRTDDARTDLHFEGNTLQDTQSWSWRVFAPVRQPHTLIDIGRGLDLGYLRGFSLAEADGFRWSGPTADVLLQVPAGASRIIVRLASGRPAGMPPPTVTFTVNNEEVGRMSIAAGWRTYSMPLPAHTTGQIVLTLHSDTFRPRDVDRASDDDRVLGVMVSRVEVLR